MTPAHKPASVENHLGRRGRGAAIAALLAVVTIAWLVVAANRRDYEQQQFFGLWRLRHVLLAATGIWVSSAVLAASLSRKALFK